MNDNSKPQTPVFRAGSPRITIQQSAQIAGPVGQLDVILLDVSAEGFRIRSDRIIVGNETVLRTSKGDEVPIEIRWTRGNEAGGVFLGTAPQVD